MEFRQLLNILKNTNNIERKRVIREYIESMEMMYSDVDIGVISPKMTMKKNNDKLSIWIMWFQGENTAPEIVGACINSVYEYMDNTETTIVLLTEKNIREYLVFPDWIEEKYACGKITKVKMTNLIRFALLYYYGGVWIDATVLVTNSHLIEELKKKGFYSNHRYTGRKDNVSKGRWTTYFIKDEKGSYVCRKLLEIHLKYWKHHDEVFDYWMFDYFFDYLYDVDSEIKRIVDNVPINNLGNWQLKDCLNDEYNDKVFEKICKESMIHKLSYKECWLTNIKGKKTFYKYILERYGKNRNNI